MIIIRNRLTGFLLPGKFPAMCIWPFILIKPSGKLPEMPVLMRHETIHGRQQIEMAWILFFIWYILEFAIRLAILRDYMNAYRRLAHEKEAHLNDDNPDYLANRKPFAWIRYI
jgi:hypothetical protein